MKVSRSRVAAKGSSTSKINASDAPPAKRRAKAQRGAGVAAHASSAERVRTKPSAHPRNNPLLTMGAVPRYDLIRASHVGPATAALLVEGRKLVDDLVARGASTWKTLVEPTIAYDDRLMLAMSAVEHLNATVQTSALRKANDEMSSAITVLLTERNSDSRLYALYKKLQSDPSLTAHQRRHVDLTVQSFELGGAALKGAPKKRFAAISKRMNELAIAFGNHALDAREAYKLVIDDAQRLRGVPPDVLAALAKDSPAGTHTVRLKDSIVLAILKHAEDRDLRREVHIALKDLATSGKFDNTKVMEELLALRQEQAELLGYPSHAARTLTRRMAKNVATVDTFLKELDARARPLAHKEIEALEAFAKEQGGPSPLEIWDVQFWTERMREAKFAVSVEEVKQYLEVDHVVKGVFSIVNRLYGVTFTADPSVPVYHPDASYVRLHDKDGKELGGFVMDLFARDGKRAGAWMSNAVSRLPKKDGLRLPQATLTCNFTPKVEGKPSLLTHDDVETLIHELGHTLHHLLTKVDIPDIQGTNVLWDFVELPSQVMEFWVNRAEGLKLVGQHVTTEKPMPDELIARMRKASTFMAGFALTRQVAMSRFDMKVHDGSFEPGKTDLMALAERMRGGLPFRMAPHMFSHIFDGGYSAGYYSYLWAELLAADAFEMFEHDGLFNRARGNSFRERVIEPGGAEEPGPMYKAWRGRDPDPAALLRARGLETSSSSAAS